MIRLRHTLTALLTVPVLFATTACDGDTPAVADPPAPPNSSTNTHQPSKRETAEHFIRRWADANHHMLVTGQTRAFLAMGDGCQGCRAVAHRVSKTYASGGHISTDGWAIRSIDATKRRSHRLVHLRVDAAPTTYADSQTGPEKHLAGGHLAFQLELAESGASWLVVSFVGVAS